MQCLENMSVRREGDKSKRSTPWKNSMCERGFISFEGPHFFSMWGVFFPMWGPLYEGRDFCGLSPLQKVFEDLARLFKAL